MPALHRREGLGWPQAGSAGAWTTSHAEEERVASEWPSVGRKLGGLGSALRAGGRGRRTSGEPHAGGRQGGLRTACVGRGVLRASPVGKYGHPNAGVVLEESGRDLGEQELEASGRE